MIATAASAWVSTAMRRVGIVTSEGALAKATGLPLESGPVVAHGGLKVRLWQTGAL